MTSTLTAAEYNALPKKRQAKEHGIQVSIMSYLDAALPASHRAIAIPNGGKRDRITGAILKREGVKAGTPDIMIVRPEGDVAFLEVKTAKGRLSENQIEFRDWCAAHHIPFAVVRSLKDVQAALVDWRVPVRARAA